MTHATYLPGDSLAIVTPRVALLTAADGLGAVDGVWRLAIAGDTDVPSILEALVGDGFAAMPGFALAVSSDDVVSLVLRHGYVARVDEPGGARMLDATGVETWAEHRIEPGAGVRLAVAGSTPVDDVRPLPIECGIVRASAITLGKVTLSGAAASLQSAASRTDPRARASDADAAGPPPSPAPSAPPPTKPDPDAAIAEPPAEVEPDAGASDEPSADGKPDSPARDEPVPSMVAASPETAAVPESVTPQPTTASKPVDSAATLTEPEDSRFDAMFGATIAGRRPEDAAVRSDDDAAAAAEPEPVALTTPADPTTAIATVPRLGDHDDRTVTRSHLRRARADAPAPADADADERPAPAVPAIRLALSTGREVVVDRPLLVGRAPQARNASGASLPILVTVDDEYVSSTHLEVRLEGDSLVVTDVSSNGTVLKRPDAPAVPMRRGEPTEVSDGAVLQISDDISISVIVS